MALETQSSIIQYTPVAGTTAFNYPYPFFEDSDIKVKILNSAGVISTPTFTVQATNGNSENGATVTLDSGTTAGDTVTISRTVPVTQEYDLQEGSTIDPTALNKALDRIVAQNQQQLAVGIERALTHPNTDPADSDGNPTLNYVAPSVESRKDKVLGYDNSGNVTALSLLPSGSIGVDTSRGLQKSGNQIGISDLGVTTSLINNLAVTTEKLNDLAVTTAKINDLAITTSKIADNAVTKAKIEQIDANTALGNITSSSATPTNVSITNNLSAAGDTDKDLVYSGTTKAYIDGLTNREVGVNQTWQSVTRAFNTDYTNNTGRPIMLNFSASSSADFHAVGITITPSGGTAVSFNLAQSTNSGGGVSSNGCTIIPNNSTYSLFLVSGSTGLSAYAVHELR
jgi:hypothetical protein|tara:strand:- start:721 stop:1914 length:1194 start_codon:yes stop_codon:yes gene_type:complete